MGPRVEKWAWDLRCKIFVSSSQSTVWNYYITPNTVTVVSGDEAVTLAGKRGVMLNALNLDSISLAQSSIESSKLRRAG